MGLRLLFFVLGLVALSAGVGTLIAGEFVVLGVMLVVIAVINLWASFRVRGRSGDDY